MKILLMFDDREFEPQPLPHNAPELIQDLELNTLFDSMAQGDEFIREMAEKVLLNGCDNPLTIQYRQAVLKDCINHPSIANRMYEIATEAIEGERKSYFGWFLRESAEGTVHRSTNVLKLFAVQLRQLRRVADDHIDHVESQGLRTLFETLRRDLTDRYLDRIDAQLYELEFRRGVFISAEPEEGAVGTDYLVRKPMRKHLDFLNLIAGQGRQSYTFRLHPRDDAGARFLSMLKDRCLLPRLLSHPI